MIGFIGASDLAYRSFLLGYGFLDGQVSSHPVIPSADLVTGTPVARPLVTSKPPIREGPPRWCVVKNIHCGGGGGMQAIAVDSRDRNFVTGSTDNTIRVHDIHNGTLIKPLKIHAAGIRGLAFSPIAPQQLYSCSDDRLALQSDIVRGVSTMRYYGHPNGVFSLSVSDDGRALATGGRDGGVRVWDARTGSCTHNFRAHNGAVMDVAFVEALHYASVDAVERSGADGAVASDAGRGGGGGRLDGSGGARGGFSVPPHLSGLNLISCGEDGSVRGWDVRGGDRHRAVAGVLRHSRPVVKVILPKGSGGGSVFAKRRGGVGGYSAASGGGGSGENGGGAEGSGGGDESEMGGGAKAQVQSISAAADAVAAAFAAAGGSRLGGRGGGGGGGGAGDSSGGRGGGRVEVGRSRLCFYSVGADALRQWETSLVGGEDEAGGVGGGGRGGIAISAETPDAAFDYAFNNTSSLPQRARRDGTLTRVRSGCVNKFGEIAFVDESGFVKFVEWVGCTALDAVHVPAASVKRSAPGESIVAGGEAAYAAGDVKVSAVQRDPALWCCAYTGNGDGLLVSGADGVVKMLERRATPPESILVVH